jgi:hypothetical protein
VVVPVTAVVWEIVEARAIAVEREIEAEPVDAPVRANSVAVEIGVDLVPAAALSRESVVEAALPGAQASAAAPVAAAAAGLAEAGGVVEAGGDR